MSEATARRPLRWAWPVVLLGAIALLALATLFVFVTNALWVGPYQVAHYLLKPRTWHNLWITLWTSLLATLCAVCLGVPVGYVLSRYRLPFRNAVAVLIDLPILLPPAAVGLFLLGLFRGFPLGPLCDGIGLRVDHATPGVVVAQFTVTAAFCIRLMKAAFDAVDPRYEVVSRSLGASLPRTFRQVTLPLATPGLLASVIIVWARAAAEWESLMLFVGGIQGYTDTLPMAAYLDFTVGNLGWALTDSLLCVVIAMGSMYAVQRIGGNGRVW
ncbi:MAG: ABC transporter permease [Armatimonadetes bacterium]|jgi:ABC-type sulfate transport system permease component|nr:ABC transporter permease [Armatimonadota bacterium]